jgi:hypothetical protein
MNVSLPKSQAAYQFWIFNERFGKLGGNNARRDPIDAHPLWAEL